MELTTDQKNNLVENLRNYRPDGITCVLCNNQSWEISDKIFELREFQGGDFAIGKGSTILPVIPMNCSRCGNTMFINALRVGVLTQPNTVDNTNKGGK